jgi:hypothetical protein
MPKKFSELKKKKNPTADVKIWKIQLIIRQFVCQMCCGNYSDNNLGLHVM